MLDTSQIDEPKKRYIKETKNIDTEISYNAHANRIMNIAWFSIKVIAKSMGVMGPRIGSSTSSTKSLISLRQVR